MKMSDFMTFGKNKKQNLRFKGRRLIFKIVEVIKL